MEGTITNRFEEIEGSIENELQTGINSTVKGTTNILRTYITSTT
jgi:hypothetical protein